MLTALACAAQDCNAVIYKNSNTSGLIPANAIFQTGTAGLGTGCQLIITSQQGGSLLIVDSAQQVLYGEDKPAQQKGPSWLLTQSRCPPLPRVQPMLPSSPSAAGCPAAVLGICMQGHLQRSMLRGAPDCSAVCTCDRAAAHPPEPPVQRAPAHHHDPCHVTAPSHRVHPHHPRHSSGQPEPAPGERHWAHLKAAYALGAP